MGANSPSALRASKCNAVVATGLGWDSRVGDLQQHAEAKGAFRELARVWRAC